MLVLDRKFETQSVDPMFLEPESGLGWYNADSKKLELVLGMQSPYEAAEALAYMLGDARAPFKPAHIKTLFAYMGGGFGGRDHSIMPLYIVLAAMFFPDRPVRLAINRYRTISMLASSGTPSRFARGSASIARPARSADLPPITCWTAAASPIFPTTFRPSAPSRAIGIYEIPKVDIATTAVHSRGVTAGSMRGYGTLQTMTALEVLIDEAAAALPLDPIEFRRRNALKAGDKIVAGNSYIVAIRTPEILDKIEKHPIWQQRSRGESARAAGRDRRRHRRRRRHQELRQRRGLRAEHGGNRRARPHRHPQRSCRYGQRHRHGAGQPGGDPSGRRRR